MGTEYALVQDPSREAFDLGRGAWYRWEPTMDGLPSSQEQVLLLLREWLGDVAWRPKQGGEVWMLEASARIWAFLETHPGARLVNDCTGEGADDMYWSKEPWEYEEDLVFYRVVGTRDGGATT